MNAHAAREIDPMRRYTRAKMNSSAISPMASEGALPTMTSVQDLGAFVARVTYDDLSDEPYRRLNAITEPGAE
jgi:hypothetical protein